MGAGPVSKERRKDTLEKPWVIRLAGIGMVLGLVAVVVVCLVMFMGGFENTVRVSVDTARAGLVLDPDAKVRIRGIQIGTVAGIENTADGARLELAIDPDQLELVPSDAVVDIRSTTVFGAKYVNFVAPPDASTEPMQPGAVVQATQVTVEFNTLFQHLNDVLGKIDPTKLNATLTAIGSALDGRGDTLGQLLVDSEAYLRDINPILPALQADLQKTAAVSGLYADTVPNLLRTTDNAVVTSATIVDSEQNIDALLANLIGLANTATPLLNDTEGPIVEALRLLEPTTGLLNEYRSGLYCTIVGLGSNMHIVNDIFGGRYPAVTMNAGVMPGGEPYKYPEDLPKVNATGGPHCEGILDRVPGVNANYLVTDTSQGHVWQPATQPHVNATVFELLFAGMPGVK
ncbi:MCE family protein [Nocardia sp. NPDC059180]|uniref:MCE family protein n=1 Tax=Nocardia sp. NPDC059180 TaxID=3346761 RepID=UPI0036880230